MAATPPDAACPQLFEVINEDYNDFVSLSTKLVDVDAAVDQFQAPLLDVQVQPCQHQLIRRMTLQGGHTALLIWCWMQGSIGKVAASLEAELGTLNEGLQRRQLIAASRALLELMQDTAHVMTKAGSELLVRWHTSERSL